jgi:hypothetical protein
MDDDSFLSETTTATPWFAEGEGDSELDLEEEDLEEELEEEEEFTDFDESSQGFSESESEASGPGVRRRGGAGDSFAFAASTTSTSSSTVFSQARGQLQLSVLPKTLPCREAERKNLHALLRDALANNTTCSICMYSPPDFKTLSTRCCCR